MRFNGHNLLAIVVAAIAIYLLEFVIFAVILSAEQYQAMVGVTADQLHPERMAFGILPPLLGAIGLSLAVKWRNAVGFMGGAMTGVWMGIFFALAGSLYGYVYGPNMETLVAVNVGHFVVCYAVAGGILGAWK